MNKLVLALSAISCGVIAMESPFEPIQTNKEIAKFSGRFIAMKRGEWELPGYSLTADKSTRFAYVVPSHVSADDKKFGGFKIYDLRERETNANGICRPPMGLCADTNPQVRFATASELAEAMEKIEKNELQLGSITEPTHALPYLQSAAEKMAT